MDVKPGHCWRCGKHLPEHVVTCDRCPKAVYCSDPCRKQDKVRHGAVECQIFGPKHCSYCKKTGNLKQCVGCNNAWYCNAMCQKKNWAEHKESCGDIRAFIDELADDLSDQYIDLAQTDVSIYREKCVDPPHYFGNTIAYDFLQLEQNEWADKPVSGMREEKLARDYHILSAGCGDLRNTILTAASLPTSYKGKLHIVLNDLDPFVMARNVLFLFILIHFDSDSIASSLATIWYSLHISKKDYSLVVTSLKQLLRANAEGLQDLMRGLVTVSNEDLAKLRKVWNGWCSLQCDRTKRSSINLAQQRQATFAAYPTFRHEFQLYLERLSPLEVKSMKKWSKHGVFLPDEVDATQMSNLPFDNPTLTGNTSGVVGMLTGAQTKFEYCIHPLVTPFRVWDCLQVRESAGDPRSSVITMYHAYIVHLLQKVKILFTEGRLYIHILVSNCLEIPRHLPTSSTVKFDRITTSNLADYIGFRRLLQTFRPLLNLTNKNAMIVTETMNWIHHTPEANVWDPTRDITESTKTTMQLCKDDTGKKLSSVMAISNQIEYHNNTSWFMAYLRATMMAGGLSIPKLDHIPSFREAMKYEGLQMRDFREELNKLVPFRYRVNARSLNSLTGAERVLEWCVPPADD